MAPTQLPLGFAHRPALGGDDFLVAPNNAEAVAWLDRWPDWPTPALVIHGEHDGVVLPSAGRANAEMIPGGRYVGFSESAHAPFLEETPTFLAELDAFTAEL